MLSLPFSVTGTTLLTGPSNVGKTRLTARAMDVWIADCGPTGIAVLDFAPEVERNGRLLGGRLSQFRTVPCGVWYGILKAHAPRTEGESDTAIHELATVNSENAARLLDAAPTEPTAVFVNDATIPFQSGELAPRHLTDYCDRAEVAVLNAFESDELGMDDRVSRHEQDTLDVLQTWVGQIVELE
jgi:hypothetical protein